MIKLKNKKLLPVLPVAFGLAAMVYLAWPTKPAPLIMVKNSPSPKPVFNKQLYPTDQVASLWAVVNKGRQLPSTYTPSNLAAPQVPLRLSASSPEMHVRADSAKALEDMFAQAKQGGINLMLTSGYRSYSQQASVYNNYAESYGVAEADSFSARPGHSEHQTGLAADIEPISRTCELDACFENTPEGRWLAANANQYGFIIRYQKTTQNLTGYQFEPWHIRFVGQALAAQLKNSGQTLEQFFGLPAMANYPSQSFELKA